MPTRSKRRSLRQSAPESEETKQKTARRPLLSDGRVVSSTWTAPKSKHVVEEPICDLRHLSPVILKVFVKKSNRHVRIDVKFSNHCYTEKAGDYAFSPGNGRLDGRIFSDRRYNPSFELPIIFRNIKTCAIYKSHISENYIVIEKIGEFDHIIYFRIANNNLFRRRRFILTVCSAHPIRHQKKRNTLEGARKISFDTICEKTWLNRAI